LVKFYKYNIIQQLYVKADLLLMGLNEPAKQSILVVDDTKDNLVVLTGLLEGNYTIKLANSGEKALRIARTLPVPDLILLDVMMPEMNGHQVLQALKLESTTAQIPVIFVTAMDAVTDEEFGLGLGAVDYITKPIQPAILKARIKTHLELKAARDLLSQQNEQLEQQVQQRTLELDLIKDISLSALATLAETRDNETGNHLFRTEAYIQLLMRQLQDHPRFQTHLSTPQQELIAHAAPLHNIGKVGIPDAILLKPGKLTPDEFEIMKQHSQIGAEALSAAILRVFEKRGLRQHESAGFALQFLEIARQIALSHHEKWDGSGYPNRLSGEAIPLPGRLMALADVFDALSCKRHYKEAFPHDKVVSILRNNRGTHFDPDIVDAFLMNESAFFEIAERYADRELLEQ
jgi:putative two-component system response regulator